MLDLKAKLLAAGLVTEEQVNKVEAEEAERRQKRREARETQKQGGARRGGPQRGERKGKGPRKPHAGRADPVADERADQARWQMRLEQLAAAGKSEQYETIRGWVLRARLDAVKAIPSEEAERFHFARHDEGISSLTLEPDLKAQVIEGTAGICAFMSNNGLAHCVVPRPLALDIGAVRPEWVRVLDGFAIVANQDAQRAAAYIEEGQGEASPPTEADDAPSETARVAEEPAASEPTPQAAEDPTQRTKPDGDLTGEA